LADGQKLAAWPAPSCHSLEYSPDGQRLLLVTGGREKTLLFEESGGKPVWEYADGYCVSHFAADRRRLLDYSWAAGLRVLNAADRSELAVLPGQYFEAFAAQPGGNLAVASNVHGFVRGYDMDSGLVRFEFQPSQTPPDLLTFLPGGEQFLTATALPDGRQWLQCRDSRSGHALHSLHGGGGTIQLAAVHPLSGELLIIGNEARLWRTMSVPPLRLLRGANTHPSAVFWSGDDVLFAPDGRYGSAVLQQWSGDAMQLLWQPADGEVGQPHVSADGRRVALGRYHSASPPVAVLERDASGVRQVAEIGLPFPLGYARLSPSGDRLALVDMAFSRAVIRSVSPAARPVMLETKGLHRISDLAWIGGGGQIAGLITTGAPRGQAGSVEETAVWDAATGRLLRSVVSGSIGTVLAASPDGALLAEAGGDRSVRLRDAATLALRRSFRAHNAPITALAWHPSRPVVATASEDLLIRLWNTGTGERLEELRGPLSPPTVLSFSPGGTRLATAARDGVARVWEPYCLTPEK
jgi:WD40 repeat protein